MDANEKAKIQEIAEWMMRNVSNPPSTQQMHEQLGFSEYRLRQGFLEVYGMTPARWFRSKRMQVAAKKLRETEDSVSMIAESVGYSNQSRFAESFRSEFGCSPLAYRNRGSK